MNIKIKVNRENQIKKKKRGLQICWIFLQQYLEKHGFDFCGVWYNFIVTEKMYK